MFNSEWWDGHTPKHGIARPGEPGRYYPRYTYPNWREEWAAAWKRVTPVELVSTASQGPHAVLGVTADAPVEVIRAAYRALALKHHPDHGGTVEKMREINLAYAAICG